MGEKHFCFQDQEMKQLLELGQSPLLTDTVEGFILEPSFASEINVTMTSTLDPALNRFVPVLISILFWKSKADYKIHWCQVLKPFKCTSWEDFKNQFPGNTSDMSDAIRKAFVSELQQLGREHWKETPPTLDIASVFRFCEVHFQRSRARISKNRAVVPLEMLDKFNASRAPILFQACSGLKKLAKV